MKTILITGATSGLGLEASVLLAREGHHVIMVGRDADKTRAMVAEVIRRSGSQRVDSLLADFSQLASVRALAAAVLAKHGRLDVLVNNAGSIFTTRGVTSDGLENTLAVNHLASFVLTNLLRERLEKSAPARIVMVSSSGHLHGTMNLDDLGFARGGYSLFAAYSRSKLANLLMMRSLAKRLQGTGVTINALHPGTVATNIWSHAPRWAAPVLALFGRLFMISAEEGARTISSLATSPEVEGRTGLYFVKNREATPAALAQDDALAERLWQKSGELVQQAFP